MIFSKMIYKTRKITIKPILLFFLYLHSSLMIGCSSSERYLDTRREDGRSIEVLPQKVDKDILRDIEEQENLSHKKGYEDVGIIEKPKEILKKGLIKNKEKLSPKSLLKEKNNQKKSSNKTLGKCVKCGHKFEFSNIKQRICSVCKPDLNLKLKDCNITDEDVIVNKELENIIVNNDIETEEDDSNPSIRSLYIESNESQIGITEEDIRTELPSNNIESETTNSETINIVGDEGEGEVEVEVEVQYFTNDSSQCIEITSENASIILSHGLGSNKSSLKYFKSELCNIANIITPCRKESNCNEESMSFQSNDLKKYILKEIRDPKKKKIILCGHSIGGNLTIEALAGILREDPEIIDYIINENKIFRIITIGSPLTGSEIAKKLPKKFLKAIGLGENFISMQEIKKTDKIKESIKSWLQEIHSKLGGNIKLLCLSGKSEFLNFMKDNLLPDKKSWINYLLNIFYFIYGIDDPNEMKITLTSFGDNDGVVTINSQEGRDENDNSIIPFGMLLKRPVLTESVNHSDFFNKMNQKLADFIKTNFNFPTEEYQLISNNILNEIKYAIYN